MITERLREKIGARFKKSVDRKIKRCDAEKKGGKERLTNEKNAPSQGERSQERRQRASRGLRKNCVGAVPCPLPEIV